MNSFFTIKSPKLLHIKHGERFYYGANQNWYQIKSQQLSGCGPTACSNLIWYLARTRTTYYPLCSYDAGNRMEFVKLMEDIWGYVTPRNMGVDNPKIFIDGALEYASVKNISLQYKLLLIPRCGKSRPDIHTVMDFLQSAFERDLPVAFLNLSNGTLTNLDSWHWVTLVGCDIAKQTAQMYDQGKDSLIDLKSWLKTTLMGGSFVVLY